MTEHDYEHTIAMVTTRLDNHGVEIRDLNTNVKDSAKVNSENFHLVFKLLREVTAYVHQVELKGTKEDGEIKIGMAKMSGEMKAKIAGLAAGVSTASFGLIEGIKFLVIFFKGHA